MSSIRRLTIPAVSTALAALVYFATAVSASAQTYLPGSDDGPGGSTAAHTSGTAIWPYLAVTLAAATVIVSLFLAATRMRHTHRLATA